MTGVLTPKGQASPGRAPRREDGEGGLLALVGHRDLRGRKGPRRRNGRGAEPRGILRDRGVHAVSVWGLIAGLGFLALLALGGAAAGQTTAVETIVFEDFSSAPPCCALPVGPVARAAVKDLPGIVRVIAEETPGEVTISFDPARVSRAEVVAALAERSFRVVPRR